jgi:SAM-dependent methyltransferase
MDEFMRVQHRYFAKADSDRFFWATANVCFSMKERALLDGLRSLCYGRKILEVGCGEGINLANFRSRADLVGIDREHERCLFAKKHSSLPIICADGLSLPFKSESFDLVFCRDFLHHVKGTANFVTEMGRICKRGGHVVAIEACGWNPVIFALSVGVRAERGLLKSKPVTICDIFVASGLQDVQIEMYQPLPLYRAILHYRFGFPALSRFRWFRSLMDWVDIVFASIIPKRFWAYAMVAGCKT